MEVRELERKKKGALREADMLLNMPRAEYEEIRPKLVKILAESEPVRAPELHEKFMETVNLDKRDASDCIWRMLNDGYLNVRDDLKVELGAYAPR